MKRKITQAEMDSREAFLSAAEQVVGPENVVRPDHEEAYRDPFPVENGRDWLPGVMPASTEEVSALLRLANEHDVPLWSLSRGKNNGYGGGEAREPHSVVLDLKRMNRIIEVNDELCYAIVEPGVTFFALYEYIRENDLKVWPSVPSLGWGSVVGNTLDRGWGYLPTGDHMNQQCGMEVVLPDGEVLRTGMSAIEGSPTGPLFKGGFGPSLDGLFFQSNLGVVTQMGIWLFPQPKAFFAGSVEVDDESRLGEMVDILADLRRKDILQNAPVVGNPVRAAANTSPKSRWFDGKGTIPPEVVDSIKQELGVKEWNARFGLYGDPEMIQRRFDIVEERFAEREGFTVSGTLYESEDGLVPEEIAEHHRGVQVGYPGWYALQCIDFRGEKGGHLDCVLILPATGEAAQGSYEDCKEIFDKYGLDLFTSFQVHPRHVAHSSLLLFDQESDEDRRNVDLAFRELSARGGAKGYSEYRTHVDYMDVVSDKFDFNNHALRSTQERLKDLFDPKGILSPGKQGVWPLRYRSSSSTAN